MMQRLIASSARPAAILLVAVAFSCSQHAREKEKDQDLLRQLDEVEKERMERTRRFQDALRDAEAGDADAQFRLARMYVEGMNVNQDYVEAIKWFRKAAEQGHAEASLLMGGMYAMGRGVEEDSSLALNWILRAANLGHSQAQYFLGMAYKKGEEGELSPDRAAAVRWFRKAAEQGHSEASLNWEKYTVTVARRLPRTMQKRPIGIGRRPNRDMPRASMLWAS